MTRRLIVGTGQRIDSEKDDWRRDLTWEESEMRTDLGEVGVKNPETNRRTSRVNFDQKRRTRIDQNLIRTND
jgi:hypothetical protein